MSTVQSIASMLTSKKIDINDPLHRILVKCSDEEVVTLSTLFPRGSIIKKLGEGVYGEVYSHNGLAVKVMPVNGKTIINETEQMGLSDVLPEIAITKMLSELGEDLPYFYTDSFVTLHKVNIARGIYPKILDDAWVHFDKQVRPSENDRPAKLLKGNQMYLVFQLSNGGTALEDFELKSVQQAMSIFNQTALGLAVAESRYQFEHRDLHIGNILIRTTADQTSRFELRGEEINLPLHGLKVTIIDFSLSRASHNDEFTRQPRALYRDLDADPDLFTGQGDIQFDVYRDMAELFTKGMPNRWRDLREKTNILWLIYLHKKLLSMLPPRCKDRKNFSDMIKILPSYYSTVDLFQDMKKEY